MNVLFFKKWDACSTEIQAFAIMHLLTGEEESDPWCILFLDNVQRVQDIEEQVTGDNTVYRMCYVTTLPFVCAQPTQPCVALVVCF